MDPISDTLKGSLTCISCRYIFSQVDTAKDQREHYKSDLHRFNLKRKMAKLPPVSNEVFQEKVKNLLKEKNSGTTEKSALFCSSCNKKYSSANAFSQHLKSRKHLDNAPPQENPEGVVVNANESSAPSVSQNPVLDQFERKEIEEVLQSYQNKLEDKQEDDQEESDEEELIDQKIKEAQVLTTNDCLFCSQKNSDLEANMSHMTLVHGFFIPDIEYLTSLEGLIKYLGEKISVGNICLHCNGKGKSFQGLEAVQAHMRDLSHCKLNYEDNEEEYDDYYDFSKDWESVSKQEGKEETFQRSTVTVSPDGSELIFEDGKSIGHRSFRIYYRQKYRPEDNRDSVVINSLMNQYRSLGWTEKWHNSSASNSERRYEKMKASNLLKLGVKENHLQRYLRKQIL